jgi:hypothetical protein
MFHLFIDSYYFYLNMPRKTRHFNKHLTSKLQFSPNFTVNSVADSNYRGKCDVGGFLIFEWTIVLELSGCKQTSRQTKILKTVKMCSL